MVAGLLAGALAALLAIALSLPLHSPDDVLFNSATVAAGALLAGGFAGFVWNRIARKPRGVRTFEVMVAAGFVVVLLAGIAGEILLERTAIFIGAIATVVFGTIALITPLLARRPLPGWSAAAVIPVLAVGVALMGHGDEHTAALTLASAAPTSASGVPADATATANSGVGSSSNFRTPSDVQGVNFVVSDGSQAQFIVREQLSGFPAQSDANVKNSALAGEIHLDGRPSTITIDLTKFTSDQSRRDNFIRQMWSRQPTATVTIDDLGGASPSTYSSAETVKRQVAGKLTIQGTTAPITIAVEAKIEGAQLTVLGNVAFKWADFGLRAPSVPGVVTVQDNVTGQILLVTKANH